MLADIKTMTEGEFEYWKKKGTRAVKVQWEAQLSVYALAACEAGRQVEHIAIVGVNRNTSEYYVETMRFDRYVADYLMTKAEKIATEEVGALPCWMCGGCDPDIKAICPAVKAMESLEPEVTELGNKIIESDDPELNNAIKQLQEARRNINHWRDIENTAKDKIDKLVLRQGANAVYSGRLILTLSEVNTQRFNLQKFKAEYPELLSDFMTGSSSLVYRVKEIGRDGR